MSFANPYNFVAVKLNVDRREIEDVKNHTRICQEKTYTGILTCSIKTLTKLFIPSTLPEDKTVETIGTDKHGEDIIHTGFKFFYYIKKNDTKFYAIPASSLKGIIRSTAEAISNSCLHMFDGKYENNSVSYSINKALHKEQCVFYDEKGNLAKGLCICCSMFGVANAKESKKTAEVEIKKVPNVFKGKIRFSDALLETKPLFESTFPLKELSSPKPHHREFYADGEFIKGRKFYYHHPDHKIKILKGSKTKRNHSITPLKRDAAFSFTVSFENLSEEEYALLLITLELEPGLGHKIGMGKPLGLGSCVIDIKEIREFGKERYLSISEGSNGKTYKDGALPARKTEIKKEWKKEIPDDLRCILTINHGFNVRYPNKHSAEFTTPLHKPCEDFSGKKINQTIPPAPLRGGIAQRFQGTIKTFNEGKRYGFIIPDIGTEDIFLHISALNNSGIKDVETGERVEFEVIDTEKGRQALNIIKL